METIDGNFVMCGVSEDDPECLHTIEDAIAYIEKIGFLPLFQNDIPGFSLEERTAPKYWWCGDKIRDPWEWRELIAKRGEIAYGKFFDKKAGFISRKWLPVFANYRRDGYDFDARWEDELASLREKRIMDLFLEEKSDNELFSADIKKLAGFGKDGEKGFEGVMTKLQMQLYLVNRDFQQKKNKKGQYYGWPVSVFCTPEHIFGRELVTNCYQESAKESFEKIVKYMNDIYPIAGEKQIKKVLG